MTNKEMNEMIDCAINESNDIIDAKATAAKIVQRADLDSKFVCEIVRTFIEQKVRSRIAQIKGSDNLRDYFAVPRDGKSGVYASVPKSQDDTELEKAAERIGLKMDGMQNSYDKIMSRVFVIRHQIEVKPDGTIDLKTPYIEEQD